MRRMRALAALVAVVLLAGCAAIPRSGPVAKGDVSGGSNGFPHVDILPDAPAPGASQESILAGFLAAAVSPDNGYEVARKFLSSGFSAQWNPDASVTIDQQSARSEPVKAGEDELQLTISPVAFVDGTGDYLAASSPAPIPLQYSFVKEGGQWRISKAPDGIVIDAARFADVFTAYRLYFFSRDLRYLVPDARWFPATRSSASTQIVKALLAGPSKWLANAVVTAFPSGTSVVGGAVPTQSGTAQVALSSAAASADEATVARMYAQLSASLASSASVTTVRLSIDGVERDTAPPRGLLRDPIVGDAPVVLKGGVFGRLATGMSPLPGIGKAVADLAPRAVTLSADAGTAAVLADGRVYAVRAGGDPKVVDDRAGLLAPSLDAGGAVWSATASGAFRVTAADGAHVDLQAAWPDGRSLVGFSLSRDGTRLAALVRTAQGLHLMVAGIVRDGAAVRSLDTPVDLGAAGLSSAGSITWVDELTLAAVGTSAAGEPTVITQLVGGGRSAQPGPDGGAVVVGGSSPQLWVLTRGGKLEALQGSGWQPKADGVSVVAVQLGRG